jgi:solute carrier family 25 (mitochondrial aspartate/glutamate transporter), member 12/13
MATVMESVKESLVGTEEGANLSAETRREFMQYAVRDEETGELYLGEKQFVDAIAPESEDYVSAPSPTLHTA